MSGISFKLGAPKPGSSSKPGPSLSSRASAPKPKPAPTPSPFGGGDDDDDDDSLPTTSSASRATANRGLVAQSSALASARVAKQVAAAQALDASVFEYDEVYDRMADARVRAEEARRKESKARKPKYVEGLAAAAEQRKLDRLRAEEKMIQKEREREGDDFAGTEEFVTTGYKERMEEIRIAEEEEKRREEKERSKRGTGSTTFMRSILEQNDEAHAAAVAASLGPSPSSSSNIIRPPSPARDSEKEAIQVALSRGTEVELDDEGRAVDKTELLAAGLNVSKKRRAFDLSSSSASSARAGAGEGGYRRQAVGTAASQGQIRARQSALIERQMVELEEKRREEERRREEEKKVGALKRRNEDSQVDEAKRRFAERKAQRERERREREEKEREGKGEGV